MKVLAIDPGSSESAFVVYDYEYPAAGLLGPIAAGSRVVEHGTVPNEALLERLRNRDGDALTFGVERVVVEWMQPRGMPTSAQEFETLFWIGRYAEACDSRGVAVSRLPRLRVKVAICGSAKANDTNIHAALIDRFGGDAGKEKAVGRKATPGPLYGITGDEWAALAVAVAWSEDAR